MTLREEPSKSRWTWRARLVLVFILSLPLLAGFCFGLAFGILEFVRLRFFLEFSSESSLQGGASIAVIMFGGFSIVMVAWEIHRLVPFFRHYRLTLKKFCHIPRSEMRELWKDYER